jgi:NitT/TauT family transport system ATP-binding protein
MITSSIPRPKSRRGPFFRRSRPMVRCGFIPLVDCALPVIAREQGFARAEGLDLVLERDVSWANIRDKVNLGHLDCAHMLAAMPIAATLGIAQVRVPVIAPFALGFNGNAITVSRSLFARMAAMGPVPDGDPAAMAAALARVIADMRAAGDEPLTFGMVFPFSCHNYELRYWLAAGGIDPDRDIRLVVIPPPLIVDSLRAGHIQGFCVGEPWNSLAVDAGLGRIVATKSQIWRLSPEKVLGLRAEWANTHGDILAALMRALDRAAAWASDASNHESLARILADDRYVGAPAAMIARILAGDLSLDADGTRVSLPDYILFRRAGNSLPSRAQALWLYSQMVRWGQIEPSPQAEALVARVFRPDLAESASPATSPSGAQGPSREPVPLLFDGRTFDPKDIAGYLAGFEIGHGGSTPSSQGA